MKTQTAVFLSLLIVLFISLIAVWFIPSIEDFMASNNAWNGLRAFVSESQAVIPDDMTQIPGSPAKKALIVVPYLEYSTEELARLKEFVSDGGILILMDDFGFGNGILEYLGVKARFGKAALLDPLFNYRHQWLPKITDFSAPVLEKNKDIDLVVLNHATIIQNVTAGEVLARSSPTSFLDVNLNEIQNDNEPAGGLPVAARIKYGSGFLILVSDPSLMINSMVNRDDNFAFLQALAELEGERGLSVDTSHLTKSPLDITKSGLTRVRDLLAKPYPLLGFVSIIFVGVTGMILRGGRTN
ncbi:MAG: DUF4350 domain-containing protein [Dehalococcoidia bacterium]|nr:DUF4350 domain-containing protein [Dehalococcoidia bacterium]